MEDYMVKKMNEFLLYLFIFCEKFYKDNVIKKFYKEI